MSKAAFCGLLLLAGLDFTVSINLATDLQSQEILSGGKTVAQRRESQTVRREPQGPAGHITGSKLANDIVDLLSMTNQRQLTDAEMKRGAYSLSNDLAELLKGRDTGDPASVDEVRKACHEARLLIDARSNPESKLTTVLLDNEPEPVTTETQDAGVSAETLAAEADPCKALHDRWNNAMEGHVIVGSTHHTGGHVEVPIHAEEPSIITEEEEELKKAFTIFLSSCGVVGFCMIAVFIATLVVMKNKKSAAKKAGSTDQANGEETSAGEVPEKWAAIDAGTVLVCDAEDADTFESATSESVIGTIGQGEKVVATGVVTVEDGKMMVPIEPTGAVNMECFSILPEDDVDTPKDEL